MTQQNTPVKNPLTIIAIFAGVAEVSGTGILPFVSADNQRLYIYFLISFPSVLTLLFFAVLFFKHEVLYAPSDYRDESAFERMARRYLPATNSASLEQIEEKAKSESEVSEKGQTEREVEIKESKAAEVPSRIRSMNALLQIEGRAIEMLGAELKLPIERNMVLLDKSGGRIQLDGYIRMPTHVGFIDVKFTSSGDFYAAGFQKFLGRCQNFWNGFPDELKNIFHAHYILVTEADSSMLPKIQERLRSISAGYPFTVDSRVYRLDDLRLELSA